MASLGPAVSLRAELIGEYGEIDELGEVRLTDEGMILEGYSAPTVGITWEELYKILQHPFAQQMLEEAWTENVLG